MTQHPDPASVREALHQMLEALLTVLDRNAAPFATMAAVDAAGKNFIERMSPSAVPAVQPAAQGAEALPVFAYALEYDGGSVLLYKREHASPDAILTPLVRQSDAIALISGQPPVATQEELKSLVDRIIEGERELDGRDPQTLCFLMAEHWKSVATERKTKADDYDRLKQLYSLLKIELEIDHGQSVMADAARWRLLHSSLPATPSPAAPTAPATVEDEREAFEAWARERNYDVIRSSLDDGYIRNVANTLWTAWEARAALSTAAVKAAEVPAPILEAARQLIIECNPRLTSYPREEIDIDNVKLVARYIVMLAAAPAQGKAGE